MNNVIKNITCIRRRLCMGQNEFAKECGINPGNFSKAVNGHVPFSERMLMRIATVGEVSYDQLVNGDLSRLPVIKEQGAKDETEGKPLGGSCKTVGDDTANELAGLKKENEMLKAQIEKQGEEIQFYRRLLLDQKGTKEP